jgi:putative aminopeptidase FrvX
MDKSAIAHPVLIKMAKQAARASGIPLQEAVRRGGGTNSGPYTNLGIPSIVLGVPVRYAHSHYGMASLADCKAAADLGVELAKRLTPEIIKDFREGKRSL